MLTHKALLCFILKMKQHENLFLLLFSLEVIISIILKVKKQQRMSTNLSLESNATRALLKGLGHKFQIFDGQKFV